ncbi:MAG: hypothetical protein ACE5LD_06095 [Candidatus Bipolaricaulia bacterium]
MMERAPLVSTIIAIGLLPVAFFFVHAFLSGLRGWRYHKTTGLLAVSWDLSMSIGYMLYRTFGGEVEGGALQLGGPILAYFAVHGLVALIVMALEVAVLVTGLMGWRREDPMPVHGRLAKPLFFLWWFAFLSGELFYLVIYII